MADERIQLLLPAPPKMLHCPSASDGKSAIFNETPMSTQAVNSTKDISSANTATKVDKTVASEKTSAP